MKRHAYLCDRLNLPILYGVMSGFSWWVGEGAAMSALRVEDDSIEFEFEVGSGGFGEVQL